MGLEMKIVAALQNEPLSGMVYGENYWFDNGLIVPNEEDAEKIIEQLYETGDFGPARSVPCRGADGRPTNRIEFGKHESFFKGSFDEYAAYCNSFWSGEVD